MKISENTARKIIGLFCNTCTITGGEDSKTCCERSYAHCPMCSYVHPRTHACTYVSHLMEESARLNLSNHLRAANLLEALFAVFRREKLLG